MAWFDYTFCLYTFVLIDSEKEEVAGGSVSVSVAPKNMSAGLASLVASYGSMTESESDQEPEGKSRVDQHFSILYTRPILWVSPKHKKCRLLR